MIRPRRWYMPMYPNRDPGQDHTLPLAVAMVLCCTSEQYIGRGSGIGPERITIEVAMPPIDRVAGSDVMSHTQIISTKRVLPRHG